MLYIYIYIYVKQRIPCMSLTLLVLKYREDRQRCIKFKELKRV